MSDNFAVLLLLGVLSGCAQPIERPNIETGHLSPSARNENQDIIASSRVMWMRENGMTASRFDSTFRYVVKDRGAGVCIEWYIYNGDIGGDGIYCFDKATRELRYKILGE